MQPRQKRKESSVKCSCSLLSPRLVPPLLFLITQLGTFVVLFHLAAEYPTAQQPKYASFLDQSIIHAWIHTFHHREPVLSPKLRPNYSTSRSHPRHLPVSQSSSPKGSLADQASILFFSKPYSSRYSSRRNILTCQPNNTPMISPEYGLPHSSRPTSPFFGANMSQAEIQEKISAARREADGLKDKIRLAKDQTADTSRE